MPITLHHNAIPRRMLGHRHRRVDHRLVLHDAGRLDSARCGDNDRGLDVVDADGEFMRGEPAEDHRVHRAQPSAGQHGDDRLGDHRHIDHHPVAFADAQVAQRTGELRGLAQ